MTDEMFKKKAFHAIKQTEADLDEARTIEPDIGNPPIEYNRAAWFGSRFGLSGGIGTPTASTAINWDEFTNSIIPADDNDIRLGQRYVAAEVVNQKKPTKRWADVITRDLTVSNLRAGFKDLLPNDRFDKIIIHTDLIPSPGESIPAQWDLGNRDAQWSEGYISQVYMDDIHPLNYPDDPPGSNVVANTSHVEVRCHLVPDVGTGEPSKGDVSDHSLGHLYSFWGDLYVNMLIYEQLMIPIVLVKPIRKG